MRLLRATTTLAAFLLGLASSGAQAQVAASPPAPAASDQTGVAAPATPDANATAPVAEPKPDSSKSAETPPVDAAPTTPQPPATSAPAPTTATVAPAAPTDPVVARVGDQEVHLSDITEAAQSLPEQYRKMPTQTLYPLLVDQAIDRLTMVAMARKQQLDKDPVVRRALEHSDELTLQNALISREVGPQITEAAIQAMYDKDVAGKTGEEEVHARHILVANEADAVKIIAELKKGADFATLAKQRSSDPGAAQGGDLGWFKKGDMLPAFADAAFALKPGQITDKPVKTQYGWHVIKLEGRRNAPAPTFAEVHDDLRQKLIQDAVQRVLAESKVGVTIERFNPDGSPLRAVDSAEPPPAPAPAAPSK